MNEKNEVKRHANANATQRNPTQRNATQEDFFFTFLLFRNIRCTLLVQVSSVICTNVHHTRERKNIEIGKPRLSLNQ